MKQFVTFVFLFVFCLAGKAGKLLLVEGNADCLKNVDKLMVELDCSTATYLKTRNFSDYLKLARRVHNWEERSLDYFFEWFNDEAKQLVAVPVNNTDQYKLVIVVKDVQKSGRITADIKLIDTKTNKTEAVFSLEGTDGDKNDNITLRDPMKDAGETIGKYLKKNVERKK